MADVAFSPTHSFTMNANKSATAHFIQGVKITVNKEGQGSVSPGSGVYFASANLRPMGGTKTFTATPASGWRWSHWEGNLDGADGGDPSLDLPMDQSRTITAVFVEQVTLTMVKELIGNLPADGNTVSPAVGETLHDKDSVVDLVATPEVVADPPQAGWRLKQWSGGGTSGDDPTIQITMDSDKTVTATFIQVHTVTTVAIEQGVIEPEGGTYDHGTIQSFFFDRQSGHQFHHWAGLPDSFSTPAWGPGTSTSNPVNVIIEQSLHIIGYDDWMVVSLTADAETGYCPNCTVEPEYKEYIFGHNGTVTAVPEFGWRFYDWVGDVPENQAEDNPLVMSMDEDKEVTARFAGAAPVDVEFNAWVVWNLMSTLALLPEPGFPDYYSGDGRLRGEEGTSRVSFRFKMDRVRGLIPKPGFCPFIVASDAYDGSDIENSGVDDCNLPAYNYKVIDGHGPYCTEVPPLSENTVTVTPEQLDDWNWKVHFDIHVGPGCVPGPLEWGVAELDAQITLGFYWDEDTALYSVSGEHDGFPWMNLN